MQEEELDEIQAPQVQCSPSKLKAWAQSSILKIMLKKEPRSNPSTETEAEGPGVQGHPRLHSKTSFQTQQQEQQKRQIVKVYRSTMKN